MICTCTNCGWNKSDNIVIECAMDPTCLSHHRWKPKENKTCDNCGWNISEDSIIECNHPGHAMPTFSCAKLESWKPKKNEMESTAKICPRCKLINSNAYECCRKCGASLNATQFLICSKCGKTHSTDYKCKENEKKPIKYKCNGTIACSKELDGYCHSSNNTCEYRIEENKMEIKPIFESEEEAKEILKSVCLQLGDNGFSAYIDINITLENFNNEGYIKKSTLQLAEELYAENPQDFVSIAKFIYELKKEITKLKGDTLK